MDSAPATDYSGVFPVIKIPQDVQIQVDRYQAMSNFIDEQAKQLGKDMSPAFLNPSRQTEIQCLRTINEKFDYLQRLFTQKSDFWSIETNLERIFDDLCTFRRIEYNLFERIIDCLTEVTPPEVWCPNAREVLLWLSDDPNCEFCRNWDWASDDEDLKFTAAERELIRARLILAAKARAEQEQKQKSKTGSIMPTQWELMMACSQRDVFWADRQKCPLEGAPEILKPRWTSVDEKTKRIAFGLTIIFMNQKDSIVATVALVQLVEAYKSSLDVLALSKKKSENVDDQDDQDDRMIEEVE